MGNVKVKNLATGAETVMTEDQADSLKKHPKLSGKFKFEKPVDKPKAAPVKEAEKQEETNKNSNQAKADKKD